MFQCYLYLPVRHQFNKSYNCFILPASVSCTCATIVKVRTDLNVDPADTLLSRLFPCSDFGVTKEDFLNLEPNFLKILPIEWKSNREFAHMLAFNRWKLYPASLTSSAPKPQPVSQPASNQSKPASFLSDPRPASPQPASLQFASNQSAPQPSSYQPMSRPATNQPASFQSASLQSIRLSFLGLQPVCPEPASSSVGGVFTGSSSRGPAEATEGDVAPDIIGNLHHKVPQRVSVPALRSCHQSCLVLCQRPSQLQLLIPCRRPSQHQLLVHCRRPGRLLLLVLRRRPSRHQPLVFPSADTSFWSPVGCPR